MAQIQISKHLKKT